MIIFPGAFKPPHYGHLCTLAQAVFAYPDSDHRVVISKKERTGRRDGYLPIKWTAEDSVRVWKSLLPAIKCQIVEGSPVTWAFEETSADDIIVSGSHTDWVSRLEEDGHTTFVAGRVGGPELSSEWIRFAFANVDAYCDWLASRQLPNFTSESELDALCQEIRERRHGRFQAPAQ